jgi:hypothetical protein
VEENIWYLDSGYLGNMYGDKSIVKMFLMQGSFPSDQSQKKVISCD